MNWDVFNGDADGLCAVHQLRLAEPADAQLVSGVKRDIALVERVRAERGDRVNVCDVSLDRNRAALVKLLDAGVHVRWFDHHYAGTVPDHPLLEAHIDTASDVCTSVLVDRQVAGRFRRWAIVAAYGDGLQGTASSLSDAFGLDAKDRRTLQDLGEDLNYNAYGDTEADLTIAPTALYRAIAPFTDPFQFVARSDVVHRIRARRHTDMERATALAPYRTCARGEVYVLPDAPWSRRVNGTFANHLAQCQPDRAHALLVPNPVGSYRVNIRAPVAAPTGASRLARAFATGGGREAAAGIDDLPAAKLDEFIERFAQAW